MAFPAFLDANVLVPIHLTDLLLRLAEAETYRPLWSEQVLEEVERNLPEVGVRPDRARHRTTVMRTEFPDALVTDYEALTGAMTNDPGDRHVLAAAVRAGAEIVVTANTRHFPASACDPYDIGVKTPDEFLLDQFDLYPEQTVRCLRALIAGLRRPPTTTEQFLARFTKTVPRFVEEIARSCR
ncbi:PIN domain-containing protein [Umezawaea beigongshangensis]|uniref:PIN domain-containing protein n=1 Tax=Umezawaea beigongshangensis TaxID=2780383 RepID=UPI0018F2024F|nr:PIN domain-containing protein [Umezawaea beigongshangensis]